MIMSKEEIQALTQEQAEIKLSALEASKVLDKPLNKLSKQQWDQIDDIANTWLWLQDHIAAIKLSDQMRAARYAQLAK